MCGFTMYVDGGEAGTRPCPCCGAPMAAELGECAECVAAPLVATACPECGDRFEYVERMHHSMREHAEGGLRYCWDCRERPSEATRAFYAAMRADSL